MIRFLLVGALAVTALAGCTWVKMEPAGQTIRVARDAEDLSFCSRRGEVTVSVRDRVGLYERNELKVRDELEVLARNEAARLQADTVQPMGEPVEGEQRFIALSCRGTTPAAVEPTPPAREEAATVETFPLRDD